MAVVTDLQEPPSCQGNGMVWGGMAWFGMA